MRLKIFQAPSMGTAMAMVRDELGPDALILASQADAEGVRITAAVAPSDAAARPVAEEPAQAAALAAPEPSPVVPAPTRAAIDPAAALAARRERLRWHGLPPALLLRLCHGELEAAVTASFATEPIPLAEDAAPLMLVGPPGAGKTMAAARLATRARRAGAAPLVITADGRRAGAAEQLAAFTRLLDLTLIVADGPAQLPEALRHRRAGMPVIIDMPGLNPSDAADRSLLRDCRAATGATIALVLPAGLDAGDAEDIALGYAEEGATLLIASRLDQSRRLGGILAAAAAGLVLTEAGVSAGVADALAPITSSFLAERLSAAPPPSRARSPRPSVLALMARPHTAPAQTAAPEPTP